MNTKHTLPSSRHMCVFRQCHCNMNGHMRAFLEVNTVDRKSYFRGFQKMAKNGYVFVQLCECVCYLVVCVLTNSISIRKTHVSARYGRVLAHKT